MLIKQDVVPEEKLIDNDDNSQQHDLGVISFHAILCKTNATIMKLKGIINSTEILILVDSGSTHNFADDTIIEELSLMVQFVSPSSVQISNGNIIRCNRICRNVEVQLPRLTITQDYYPFSIGGADLVLGIQ